ncbi:hypothetical protein Tco_1145317 [Tanacetum coccineum]
MEDGIFFNQSKYIKEMLKKFGLEDSKPTKTPMSTEISLTKVDEADPWTTLKYRENPKTTHLEVVKRIFREFLDPKKKKEIESWLEDSRIVDSLDGSDEIEYFVPSPPWRN